MKMKVPTSGRDPEAELDLGPTATEALDENPLETQSPEALEEDHRLAQRCAAGEVEAWEEFYARYHDRLMASIECMLPAEKRDLTLVDEIAARVWYVLVADDGELLLRYDPARGARLITFMRALAKDLLSRHFRSERRRLGREAIACDDKPVYYEADLDQTSSHLDEFLDSLSESDRSFCDQYLLDNPPDDEPDDEGLSSSNIWQKTRRIYNRLIRFFGGSS